MANPEATRTKGTRKKGAQVQTGLGSAAATTTVRTGGGGPTATGGYNFQAAVTAIAMTYAACGARLSWLEGLIDDTPVSVASETGSGGDDLRLVLTGGATVDVQVKKGLTQGASLWTALVNLGEAINAGKVDFGVLVVSPSSSAPVREQLAADLVLIAEGGSPEVDDPGQTLVTKFKDAGLDAQSICAKLRIATVS